MVSDSDLALMVEAALGKSFALQGGSNERIALELGRLENSELVTVLDIDPLPIGGVRVSGTYRGVGRPYSIGRAGEILEDLRNESGVDLQNNPGGAHGVDTLYFEFNGAVLGRRRMVELRLKGPERYDPLVMAPLTE